MYGCQDLERLYLEYQNKWESCGMPLRAYRNNGPLKMMENFIKGICKLVLEVDIIGGPFENDQYPEVSAIVTV